jgi:hypothetical protein
MRGWRALVGSRAMDLIEGGGVAALVGRRAGWGAGAILGVVRMMKKDKAAGAQRHRPGGRRRCFVCGGASAW